MIKTKDTSFASYKIRTQQKAPFASVAFIPKMNERKLSVESAMSVEDSINQMKDLIRQYAEKHINWSDVKSSMFEFNSDFVKDLMGGETDFSFDIVDDLSIRVYAKKDAGRHKTNSKQSTKPSVFNAQINVSNEELDLAGFYPSTRYVVEEDGNNLKLIFHSFVGNKYEKVRVGSPAITIASSVK